MKAGSREVTLSGMLISVREEQLANAELAMASRVSGRETVVSSAQLRKALKLMFVMPDSTVRVLNISACRSQGASDQR